MSRRLSMTVVAAAFGLASGVLTAVAPAADAQVDGATTIAGGGNGYGGPATSVFLGSTYGGPSRVAVSSADGSLFIADGFSSVVRVPAAGGTASVFAGTSTSGYAGDGGPATAAQLDQPRAVAVDSAGDVFVAEAHHIRRIAGGTISTIAGNGSAPDGSTGVAATATGVAPRVMAAFPDGRVVFAEGSRVRIVGTDGQLSSLTAAGATFGNVVALAVAPDGAVFVGDGSRHYVYRVVPGGTPTVVAGDGSTGGYMGDGVPANSAPLAVPNALAVAPDGSVYVSDPDNGRLRRFTVGGTISTVIDGSASNYTCNGDVAMASTGAGAVWCNPHGNSSAQVLHLSSTKGVGTTWAGAGWSVTASPDGVHAADARIDPPKGVTEDTSGRVWFSGGGLVRYVDAAGLLHTASAPANGPTAPAHLAPAGANAVYAADPVGNKVWRISTDGTRVVVAGNGTTTYGGDGASATSVGLDAPQAVATAPDGTIYIADSGAGAVRAVDPATGAIRTVLSGADTIKDVAVAADGTVGVTTDANPIEITSTSIRTEPGWQSYTTLTSDGSGGWYAAFDHAMDDIQADGSVHPVVGVYGTSIGQLSTAPDGSLLFDDSGLVVQRLSAPTVGDAPAAPTSFTATPGEGRVTLNWTAPAYSVLVTMQQGEATSDNVNDGTVVAQYGPPPVTVFRDGSALLPIGVDYTYTAFTHSYVAIGPNTLGNAFSVAARATAAALADNTPPGPVANLNVDAAYDTIHLSWTKPTDDDLDSSTPIVVRMATGSTPPATPADGVAVPVSGDTAAPAAADLSPFTDYSFSIFAIDLRGNVSTAVTTTAQLDRTPAGPVTSLVGTPDYQVATATWTNPTDVDFAHAIWAIGPGTDTPAPPTGGCSSHYPSSTSTARFDNLTMGSDYTIGVWTCDIHGNMSDAAVTQVHTLLDTQSPGPVTNVQATGGNNVFTLTFSPPTDNDYARTIVRYQAGDVPPATPNDGIGVALPAGTNTTTLGGGRLPGNKEYAVSLWAQDAHGLDSDPATTTVVTLPDTTPPAAPTITQVSSVGSLTARFCYSEPWPVPNDFVGVYADITDGRDATDHNDGYVATVNRSTTCANVPVPTNYHTYRITLWPFDTTGNVGQPSSADVLAQPNYTELPTSVAITSAAPTSNDHEIAVTWTAPSSPGTTALTAYRVVVSQNGTTVASKDVGPDVLTTTVGGLPANVVLSVVVHASNTLGWNTVGAAVTTTADDVTAPATVTSVTAAAKGPGTVRLTWKASTSGDVTEYLVVRTDGGSIPTSPDNGGAIWTGTANAVTLTGQPMHADHLYTVFARDAVGNTDTGRGVTTTATKLSIAAPKTFSRGARFAISGTLRRWTSGKALGGRALTLCHRQHGTVTWYCGTTTTTAKDGSWRVWRRVRRATDFQIRYHGYGRLMGSLRSATVAVS